MDQSKHTNMRNQCVFRGNQGKSIGLSPTPGFILPLVLAGVGAEGAEKILRIWGCFSLIFFIKSMNLRLNPQKNSRLGRAFPETSIFEL